MRFKPPPRTSMRISRAPASSAFSSNSFTTDAGRSITSPAAIRSATSTDNARKGERSSIIQLIPLKFRDAFQQARLICSQNFVYCQGELVHHQKVSDWETSPSPTWKGHNSQSDHVLARTLLLRPRS